LFPETPANSYRSWPASGTSVLVECSQCKQVYLRHRDGPQTLAAAARLESPGAADPNVCDECYKTILRCITYSGLPPGPRT
jgi:hypothetical protein